MPTPLERVTLVLKLTDAGDWTRARHETLALQKDLTMWPHTVDRMQPPTTTDSVCKSTAAGALELLAHAADHLQEYAEYPRPDLREQAMACALEGIGMLKDVRDKATTGTVWPPPAAPPRLVAHPSAKPMLSRFIAGNFKKGLRPTQSATPT